MTDSDRSGGAPKRFDAQQVTTAIAAVLLVWFAIANWQRVPIDFWVISVHAPLTIVIAVSACLGGFVAWLARRRARASKDSD